MVEEARHKYGAGGWGGGGQNAKRQAKDGEDERVYFY
jgi:hypothetical protein